LHKCIAWTGAERGIYHMRRQYIQYLRGLPGFADFRKNLVTATEPEAVETALNDILVAYDGFEMKREDIALVDYHSNCAL
jgi:tRNA-dihydrouridine synthase